MSSVAPNLILNYDSTVVNITDVLNRNKVVLTRSKYPEKIIDFTK